MENELTTVFEQIRPQLRAYILRITAHADQTNDILQETWYKAYKNISSFSGQSSLKTWLFAIASNLAKDYLKRKKRWPENVTDLAREAALGNPRFFQEAMHIRHTSPQGQFEIREHISFCFTCVSKSLPLEQQVALLLKEVHAFKVREIAEIMTISEAMVKYYLHLARQKMMDIFDRRCALINKEGICHQCTELNGIFNPKQNSQEALRKIEMVRETENKSRQNLLKLRMQIVKALDPFESPAAELQLHPLEHNRALMEDERIG